MLGRLGEGLRKRTISRSVRHRAHAHQIPSLVPGGLELFFAHDNKDILWGAGRGMESEVQCDETGRGIGGIIETETELGDDLRRVVARSENKRV